MKKRKNKKTKQKNKAKKPNEPLMMSSFRILKCKTWFQQYNFPQIKKISVSKQNIIHITVLYYFITVCNIKVEWPKVFFFFFHGNPNSWWHPWDTHTHAHTLRVKRERERNTVTVTGLMWSIQDPLRWLMWKIKIAARAFHMTHR